MPIVLIASLLIGTGVSLAAENSLPGDSLYSVKLQVNERVLGWTALSGESQARWQTVRAGRRLGEATELAAKGEFSVQAAAQVEENFDSHVAQVAERILAFDAENDFQSAAEVTSEFETSLKAHEKILAGLRSRKASAGSTAAASASSQVEKLILKVHARSEAVAKARANREARLTVQAKTNIEASARAKLKAAQAKIEEAANHISKIREMLGADATVQAQARLELAEKAVAQGKMKLESKAYGEAFAAFQRAHRIAQEAKLLIEARNHFDIDIRLNGAAEVESLPGSNTKTEVKAETDATLRLEF